MAAKRLELLRELVPASHSRGGARQSGGPANVETTVKDLAALARALGLQIQILKASTSSEIDAAFATFVRERPDALFVGSDPLFTSRRVQLANLAARHVFR